MKKVIVTVVASFTIFLTMPAYAKDVLVCQGYGDASSFWACWKNGASFDGKNISNVYRLGWHLITAFRNNKEDDSMQFTYIFEK